MQESLAKSVVARMQGHQTKTAMQRHTGEDRQFGRVLLDGEASGVLCACGHLRSAHLEACAGEDCECQDFFEKRQQVHDGEEE